MQQGIITVLAIAMAAFCAPLFLDLALCIVGNLAPVRRPRGGTGRQICLAVVVPAHDEELMVARTIESVRASDSSVPIFVVAHNCSDKTAQVAEKAGARVFELNDPKLRGKGAALLHGFHAALEAGSNAVLVVDADSVVCASFVAATRAALEDGAEATQCRSELELPSSGRASPMVRLRLLAFRGMNVLRARGRAGLGLSTGVFGNGFALTAETLARVPFLAKGIAEDAEYHVQLVCAGIRVHWVGDASILAALAPTGGTQATQDARWEGGRANVANHATRPLLRAVRSGRWRAIETLADVWSLPLSRAFLALLLTLALPLTWLHLYALACAAIASLYVLQSALLGNEPLRELAALAVAPFYVVWRGAITPLVARQARRQAVWVRTKREGSQR